MAKRFLDVDRATSPIIWLIAIACSVLTIAVILAGIISLLIYVILHPKVPTMTITYAHLDTLNYDQYGQLGAQIALVLVAENKNSKVDVSFSDLKLSLQCHGSRVAVLVAIPFEVTQNSTQKMNYVVQSSSIPLLGNAVKEIDAELKNGMISFTLSGYARASWSLGAIHSVRFYTHLDCELQFFLPIFNGNSKSIECHSKIR